MVRLIILILAAGVGFYCYTNWDNLKESFLNNAAKTQSVQIYNSEMQKSQKEIDKALEF